MKEEVFTGVVVDVAFGGSGIVRHEGLAQISHKNLRQCGQDVASDLFSKEREHCQTIKASDFEGKDEATDCSDYPKVCEKSGLVVFIPFVAVGDIVTFHILSKKKNFATGRLLEVITPSLDRTPPPCPYFGNCGGCQLQHVNYEAQKKYKIRMVVETLQRIGGIALPPISFTESLHSFGYREHITLQIRSNDIGYMGVDNCSLIPIEQCLIFSSDRDPLINKVRELTKELRDPSFGRVTLFKGGGGSHILFYQLEQIPQNGLEVFKKVHPSISGIIAKSKKETLTFGQIETKIEVLGQEFLISPLAFLQNNRNVSEKIYQHILRLARASHHIVDLYCGIGISTLLLGREGKQVIGVEGNPFAIELAKKNSRLTDSVSFLRGDVKKIAKELRLPEQDLVILNPPRTGLEAQVTELLVKMRPKEIIYISCMPATLSRDLRLLKEVYEVQECALFDMFPQTTHVETLVHLKRTRK